MPDKTTIELQLRVGDVISWNVPDPRLWRRLWCFILRRPAPTRRESFMVTHAGRKP